MGIMWVTFFFFAINFGYLWYYLEMFEIEKCQKPLVLSGIQVSIGRHGGFSHETIFRSSQYVPIGQNISTHAKIYQNYSRNFIFKIQNLLSSS